MKVSLSVDAARWLQLPPLVDGTPEAAQWEDGVIDGMRAAWNGALDPTSERILREALRNGIRQVSPDDSVTLQFWPDASIANAVVHVTAGAFAPDEPKQLVPLADLAYATEPVTALFETDALGSGVEARYLANVQSDPVITLGGVNYLFANDFGYVAVGVEPTLPAFIGILLEPLRDVVRSIRVIDDAEGRWRPGEARETDLPSRGEDWDTPAVTDSTLSEAAR